MSESKQQWTRWPRNTKPLRCWQCNKTVQVGDGIMPTDFEHECYHDSCHLVSANRSGGYFPGGMSPLPDDVLAERIKSCEERRAALVKAGA